MKKIICLVAVTLSVLITYPSSSQMKRSQRIKTPLDVESLEKSLSYVRSESSPREEWPRIIQYVHEVYNYRADAFQQEERVLEIQQRPLRIIPHAVGVAEILWAICPRERIVAFNEFAADPDFCLIADQIRKRGPIFRARETELVIGYRPDLVFTVFYSGADFKEKLTQANIPFFDLGYFGTIESIIKQILLIGEIIGEEENAKALVTVMEKKIQELKDRLPKPESQVRVVCYDEGGYIPGESSNFNSICQIIGVVNVGAEQGIRSWSQIDYESLLQWDPDIIVVPEESSLKEQLMSNQVLSHARAIKKSAVYYIPRVCLTVDSQYILLSANVLAGIVYGKVP